MFSKDPSGFSLDLDSREKKMEAGDILENYFSIIQEKDDGRRGRGGKTDVVPLKAKATGFPKGLVDSCK